MKSNYQILNEKLEKEIKILENKIFNQVKLIEANIQPTPIGRDPGYDAAVSAASQNRGYISGLAGGNSDVVVANPTVIDQNARKISKPLSSDTLGLGMGMGLDSQSFENTKNFIRQHAPDLADGIDQQTDPNAIGYLSWKAVNTAVTNRDTKIIRDQLQKWGLHHPESTNIPNALGNEYYGLDAGTAFAKKLKKMEDTIAGKREKGSSVSNKTIKILKTKK